MRPRSRFPNWFQQGHRWPLCHGDAAALESKAENKLISTADTQANGLFTITDALLDENIATLGIAGIKITKDKLFDMSVIKEIYDENPELKTTPAPA